MNTLTSNFPMLAMYTPAIIALLVLCMTVLIQSVLAGVLGLANSDEIPGKPLVGDHDDFSFRVIRTYQNAVENHSVFAASLLVAALAGAEPWLVNWLAGAHVAIRMAFSAIYYRGMGKPGGGIRTLVYVFGLATNFALAAVALFAIAT